MISAIGIAAAGLNAAGVRVETAARQVAASGGQAANAVSAQTGVTGSAPGGGSGLAPASAIAAQEGASLGDAAISFKEAELNYRVQAALLGRLHDIEGELLKAFD